MFVTHSIHEAVFLSSRVVDDGGAARAAWSTKCAIDEPYPRSADFMVSPRFSRVRQAAAGQPAARQRGERDEALHR